MPTLHLLGTGAALSDPHRTTTMLAFHTAGSLIVVDCGGDVVQRLMAAALPLNQLAALIVTHEHADHVSGFPLFMEKIWLAGRRHPIPVYGIGPAIAQARRAFESFNTDDWEGLPAIEWHEVAPEPGALVLDDAAWHISAAPGVHSVPVIGLRVEARHGGGVVAYSCDTEPCDAISALAQGATLLVHEATGDFAGHSSAEGAARLAARANVGRLLLVHLPPASHLGEAEMARAQGHFPATEKGAEGGQYDF